VRGSGAAFTGLGCLLRRGRALGERTRRLVFGDTALLISLFDVLSLAFLFVRIGSASGAGSRRRR